MKLTADFETVYNLSDADGLPPTRHRFEERHIHAVQAALACRRPLLVRGEPGIGKSQLARAAAHVMGVPFLYHTMTAEAECRDLLYAFDAVARLAQAQVLGRVGGEDWRQQLTVDRFILPGPLWWALDWQSAFEQCLCYGGTKGRAEQLAPGCPKDWAPGQGCVVLVDEIDKAEGDVPNALLESLGVFSFSVPEAGKRVALAPGCPPPLIVITTNEERELPRAFLRRCLVLQMDFSKELLLCRGKDHFGERIADSVYESAADQILKDREAAPSYGPVCPGIAEYLDLLGILAESKDDDAQTKRLQEVKDFVGAKNPGQHRRADQGGTRA
jgi:MoxR-like ATPase